MNILYIEMISSMLETPPGINCVFSCMPYDKGYKWTRDYDKTSEDSGWEESVENHESYLKSLAYEVYALCEIVNCEKINIEHWRTYNLN